MSKGLRLFLAFMLFLSVNLLADMICGSEARAQFIIKMGHDSPETSHLHEFAKKFKEVVEVETKSQVKVEIYPAAQLGSEGAMFEQAQLNTLQIAIGSSGMVSIEPKLGVFELPYILRNREHMIKVLDGPIGDELANLILPRGIRVLIYADHGFRVITNKVRPIVKPEDLKGLKIRTPPNKLRIKIFNTFGAAATPLPFTELFMAMQTGVVDGQENPLPYTYDMSFYEVQKYVSLSNHVYSPLYVLINEKFFQSLPQNLRDSVKKAAQIARDHEREFVVQRNKTAVSLLEGKGMKVNEVDTNAFIKASKVIWDDEEKTYTKRLIDSIVNY
jgi:TRAP-type transport system periplasmic protein